MFYYAIENIKVDLVNVTPEIARQLIDSTMYERQRPISDDHVRRLATEMTKGHFIAGTEIHFAVVARSLYLINGNHTIRAVALSGVTIPLTFLYTHVERMSEVDRLYARHDQHRMRNWQATFKAHGMFDNISADSNFVQAAGAAMRYILVGLDRPARDVKSEETWSRDLRVEAFREYATEVDMLFAAISQGTARAKRIARRSPLVAVGLETFRFQPSKAAEFWGGLARDNGLTSGDPRKTLLDWSTGNPVKGAGPIHANVRAASLAWNAFFEDRELSVLRANSMASYRLAGTPWADGKRPELECMRDKEPKHGLVKRPAITPVHHIEFGTETLPDGRTKTVAVSPDA